MTLMIIGLTLWWASHLYPIYLPGKRAATLDWLGGKLYKIVFSIFSVFAIAFMVLGYQKAAFINVWTPPVWTIQLNNLLMLLAVLLMGATQAMVNSSAMPEHTGTMRVLPSFIYFLLIPCTRKPKEQLLIHMGIVLIINPHIQRTSAVKKPSPDDRKIR